MNKKPLDLVIYGHGGSQNHGNEAIVRGVRELFPDARITLYSSSPQADIKFGLDDVCEIRQGYQEIKNRFLLKLISFCERFFKYDTLRFYISFRRLIREIDNHKIYMLEAGDQYCEHGNHRRCYAFLNKLLRRRNVKTVMLGCTINPEIIKLKDVQKDLKRYSLIIARESLTYQALLQAGISQNVVLAPCPAFAMKSQKCDLPIVFDKFDVVGINIGFLAQGNEVFLEKLIANYENVIQYILENTELYIALIPHVNWDYAFSDFIILDKLYEKFKNSGRVLLLKEQNAPQQKYVISQLKYFIVLRTHATIPAIEQNIPTLITGYKIKSTGIVRDIFDTNVDVLASVQQLQNDNEVKNKFKWLVKHEKDIVDCLRVKIPQYKKKLCIICDEISKLTVEN